MRAKGVVNVIVQVLAPALLGAVAIVGQTSEAARQQVAPGREMTLTGVVSDSMCGTTQRIRRVSAAYCVRTCVKQGGNYALVVGMEVYTLAGHEAELDTYAAKRVTVKGTVTGKTVAVSSVATAAKAP